MVFEAVGRTHGEALDLGARGGGGGLGRGDGQDTIQGYTDSTGTPEHNDQLGEQRAEAVRRFLNRQGVALNRMATISYGQEQPVASNETPEGRSQNRRVEISIAPITQ